MRAVRSLPCLDFFCFPLAVRREKKETFTTLASEKKYCLYLFFSFYRRGVNLHSSISNYHSVTGGCEAGLGID